MLTRLIFGSIVLVAYASRAHAHGFGQRYDLPLPLWLWVTGAAATILISFIIMALFVRTTSPQYEPKHIILNRGLIGQWLSSPLLVTLLRTAAVALFLLTIATGLFGTQDPYRNLVPTMVWVVWWIGFAFVCALVGDLWALINPLETLFRWLEELVSRTGMSRRLSLERPYPERLGCWPAVVVFLAFAWTELVSLEGDVPGNLAKMMVAYSLWTCFWMVIFGRKTWLQHGEAFTIAFGVLGRFAPLHASDGNLLLRAPAIGLLDGSRVTSSLMVFVLTMLATVSFDGLLETPLWVDTTDLLLMDPAVTTVFQMAAIIGFEDFQILPSIALLAVSAFFWMIYLFCSWTMARLTKTGSAAEIAHDFVLTLVPIAIAYHLAHYLSMLLTTGQFIIPLASDPFGYGWDLFGTATYQVDLTLVSARFVWFWAAAAIVLGHVAAVWLAHIVALMRFPDRRTALLSQIPLMTLMIFYTMASLWILAQPIVG